MELYIIAGPNCAGKTTFAHEFLPKYTDCTNFVNADLIARAIAPARLPSWSVAVSKNSCRRVGDGADFRER